MSELNRIALFDSGWFDLDELGATAEHLNGVLSNTLVANAHGGYSGVIALHGSMGAGKTTLVNALCRLWGVDDGTSSATFGIVHCYKAGEWNIFHQDWYRLKGEDEAWELGLSEYFDEDALSIVEWPERAPSLMPSDALLLELEVQPEVEFPNRRLILSQLKTS